MIKAINAMLSFAGFAALLGAIILNFLGHENGSYMFLSISALSFLLMLILHFYKMYLIMNFRKSNGNWQDPN